MGIFALLFAAYAVVSSCASDTGCRYDTDCPGTLRCISGKCQSHSNSEDCPGTSCQEDSVFEDGGAIFEEDEISTDPGSDPSGTDSADSGTDAICTPTCGNHCCGENGCNQACPDLCPAGTTCSQSAQTQCECVDPGGWIEKITNGNFAQGLQFWPVKPPDGQGTAVVESQQLTLHQTGEGGSGIVLHQVIDLSGTSYQDFVFSALVDPKVITDSVAPGIGILLDAYKTPAMLPADKMFIQFNRCEQSGPSAIAGSFPAGYPVFDLWLLVSAGKDAVGVFQDVSFKVHL